LTVFCCYVRAALCGAAPKAPQVLYSAADGSEDGTQRGAAPVSARPM
jgi:hypothetical protein